MNTQFWIQHFEASTAATRALELPAQPCQLPEAVRRPLGRSLAVFQLGECGGGTRLRRYAREVAPLENFKGYQRAVDLFVSEEQGHAQLLERVMKHLDGRLLKQHWSNTIFRRLRILLRLDFAIQVLLTAELIAEVYYGTLYLRVDDAVVKKACLQILRDEMKHLEFQRQFFAERLAGFSPAAGWFWRLQFRAIHVVTACVVAWDHRACLNALGMRPSAFLSRALEARERFLRRLAAQIQGVAAAELRSFQPARVP